jgi:hypothetical protein
VETLASGRTDVDSKRTPRRDGTFDDYDDMLKDQYGSIDDASFDPNMIEYSNDPNMPTPDRKNSKNSEGKDKGKLEVEVEHINARPVGDYFDETDDIGDLEFNKEDADMYNEGGDSDIDPNEITSATLPVKLS